MLLHVNQGTWAFVEGAWREDADGVILAPPLGDQHLAFFVERAYADLEAEFEFRRDGSQGGVGLIVRAQDARRYHGVEFPFCSQQIREGHFWAAITRMDETGYAKVLMCERVPGVPAEAGLWQKARVTARGDEIRLWVNGRPLPPVQDRACPPAGFVGLMSWDACSVRNLRVSGTESAARVWDAAVQPVRPWFHPWPTADKQQGTPGLTRASNGDLLLVVNTTLLRSGDLGRTWQEIWNAANGRADTSKPGFPGTTGFDNIGTLAATPDGQVILVRLSVRRPFVIEVARSSDCGRTWSKYGQVGELKLGEHVNQAYLYGSILELKDGGLLAFGHCVPDNPGGVEVILHQGIRYRPAPVPGQICFCLRSDDGGRTWSDPVNLDGANPRPDLWMSYNDQASEVNAIETLDGEIVAFNRPGVSWAMWETRSRDGGRTWSPFASGPFLSYACAAPPRATASGSLVVGGRFPALAVRVSRDNGMTWETYRIDTEPWAMGGMFEVAPDVVLWVYASGARQLRAQHIRITPTGLEPLPVTDAQQKRAIPQDFGIDPSAVRVIDMPELWQWKMDPQDHGVGQAWFSPQFDDSDWSPVRTEPGAWGRPCPTGFGWYRTRLPVSKADIKTAYAYLYFGASDEDAWVYVNGQAIFEHSCQTTGLRPEEIWERPFVVPLAVSSLCGNDLLAVRVLNRTGEGGLWKPVRLILSHQKLGADQIGMLCGTR